MHSELGVQLRHQIVGYMAQAFDQAADVGGAGRFNLRLAVVVQSSTLIGQDQIGDIHPLNIAGQRHGLEQLSAVIVGIVADHDAGMRLARFSLTSVWGIVDEPDIAAPDQFHAPSNPSALSAG